MKFIWEPLIDSKISIIFIMKDEIKIILQFFTKRGKKKLLINQFFTYFYKNIKEVKYNNINNSIVTNWKSLKMIQTWFEQNKSYIFLLRDLNGNKKFKRQNLKNIRYKLVPLYNSKYNYTTMLWLKNELNIKKSTSSLYNHIFNKLKLLKQIENWNSNLKTDHYDLVIKNKRYLKRKPNYNKFTK